MEEAISIVLYTPLSVEDIFNEKNDDFSKERQVVSYKSRQIFAEQTSNGQYELIQLMSTNPNDFLMSEFTPGIHIHSNQIEQTDTNQFNH